MKKIDVYADVTRFAASAWVGQHVVLGLLRTGADVVTVPIDLDDLEAMKHRNQSFLATLGAPRTGSLRVVVKPASWLDDNMVRDAIVVTMWETDTLLPRDVDRLNKAKAVIVATKWQQTCFKQNGVRVPVYIANYGIGSDFTCPLNQFPKRTVFLTAGRTVHGTSRKGVDAVIAAFALAFPYEQDVVLQIKVQEDCPVSDFYSPRIQVIRSWLKDSRMAQWYQQGLAYVNASMGECWGLHMHEAMACGKPVIGALWGGVTEFINEHNSYVLPHKLVKAYVREEVHFHERYPVSSGRWASVKVDDIAKAMRYFYENPVDAFLRGLQAAQDVRHLTLDNMYKHHNSIILKYA